MVAGLEKAATKSVSMEKEIHGPEQRSHFNTTLYYRGLALREEYSIGSG